MSYHIVYNNTVTGLDLDERKREIKELLTKHNCEITFTKVDGTVRTMPCTLQAAELPIVELKEDRRHREPKPENISAWCLDKQAWRSFRVANVTEVKVIDV